MVVGRSSFLSPGYQSIGVPGEPETRMWEMLLPGLSLSFLADRGYRLPWVVGPGQLRWPLEYPAASRRQEGTGLYVPRAPRPPS